MKKVLLLTGIIMSLGLTSCGSIENFEQELPGGIDKDDMNIVEVVGGQSLDRARDIMEAQEQR